MIDARSKGANGEREFCDWLFKNFSLEKKPERNLEQVRSGGADVICNPFAFEVKRREKITPLEFWFQIQRAVLDKNGPAFGLEPVVAFRPNRAEWEFLICARHLHGRPREFVRLTEFTFKIWAQKFVEDYHRGREIEGDSITRIQSAFGGLISRN